MKKENIQLEVGRGTEVLLGRDTRPSGKSLLEAAKKVWRAPSLLFILYNYLH